MQGNSYMLKYIRTILLSNWTKKPHLITDPQREPDQIIEAKDVCVRFG